MWLGRLGRRFWGAGIRVRCRGRRDGFKCKWSSDVERLSRDVMGECLRLRRGRDLTMVPRA